MNELFQLAASVGGIGGLVAVIILFLYRHDRKESLQQMRDDRKFMEERLDKVITAYNETTSNNIKILTELYTYLRLKNGSKG